MKWVIGNPVTLLTTKKLADLIAKRHKCLFQLRDLGRKQTTLISTGDMAALLRVIAAKNQLILALQAIEQELAPYHAQDPDSRKWESPEERTKCAAQAYECSQLLEEVMQLERSNEENMTHRRDQVAGQLQAAQAASTARGAYQAQQNMQKSSITAPNIPLTSDTNQHLDIQSEA